MPEEDLSITNRDKILLRELSTDSRVSFTKLARAMGCSVVTANKMLNRLTTKLDIRFTLEVDLDKLGLTEKHVIYIKFGKKPDENMLYGLFRNDPFIQDAYVTKGDFDLFVFVAADTSKNYIRWETEFAANLSEYLPELRPSDFVFNLLGFMPLNSSFVDFIKEGIKVDKKDKVILQLLNGNSRISYRELSQKLGINEDTIRYRIFKLTKNGIISRFTIAVQKANGFVSAYFVRYSFDKRTISDIFPEQRKYSIAENEPLPLLNRTPILVLLSGSYRFFAMSYGKTKEIALVKGYKWHVHLLRNNRPHEAHAIVIKPIKGLLPLRNLDPKKYYRFIWTD